MSNYIDKIKKDNVVYDIKDSSAPHKFEVTDITDIPSELIEQMGLGDIVIAIDVAFVVAQYDGGSKYLVYADNEQIINVVYLKNESDEWEYDDTYVTTLDSLSGTKLYKHTLSAIPYMDGETERQLVLVIISDDSNKISPTSNIIALAPSSYYGTGQPVNLCRIYSQGSKYGVRIAGMDSDSMGILNIDQVDFSQITDTITEL